MQPVDLLARVGTSRSSPTAAVGLGQLVHRAVRARTGSFADLDPGEFRRSFDTNGSSHLFLAHALRGELRTGTTFLFLTSIAA